MCETDAAQGAHVRGSDGVRMCVQDADGQGAGVPGSAGVRAGALRDRLARDRLLPQPPPPLLRKQGAPAAPRVLAVGAAWLPSGPCTRASECAWAAHERHAHTNNARERACAPPSRSRGAALRDAREESVTRSSLWQCNWPRAPGVCEETARVFGRT